MSKYPCYMSSEREMLALAVVDSKFNEPGTEVWVDTSENER